MIIDLTPLVQALAALALASLSATTPYLVPLLRRYLHVQLTATQAAAVQSDAVAGATLQSAVQGMATAAGAPLSSMETLPAEQSGLYRRIGLRVATAAPWPVLVALLRAVEQATPRMLVDDLQLRAPPVELRATTSPVTAAFTIVAFRAVSPSAGAAAGGTPPGRAPAPRP